MKRNLISLFVTAIILSWSLAAYSALPFLKIFIPQENRSCPQALPTNHPQFCQSFKSVAQCHCTAAGLPQILCQDINGIYNRMITVFGSQRKACEYQHDVSVQVCMDDWNCYRLGGRDSKGNLCSQTGKAC